MARKGTALARFAVEAGAFVIFLTFDLPKFGEIC
jgi:hypothetical protein